MTDIVFNTYYEFIGYGGPLSIPNVPETKLYLYLEKKGKSYLEGAHIAKHLDLYTPRVALHIENLVTDYKQVTDPSELEYCEGLMGLLALKHLKC